VISADISVEASIFDYLNITHKLGSRQAAFQGECSHPCEIYVLEPICRLEGVLLKAFSNS
jgi:hypothetical protein